MVRITKKYRKACEMLEIPIGAEVPHEALYGMLALRGFEWNKREWTPTAAEIEHRGSIRLTAPQGHIKALCDTVQQLLLLVDVHVHKVSGPHQNRKSDSSRMYIHFSYRE